MKNLCTALGRSTLALISAGLLLVVAPPANADSQDDRLQVLSQRLDSSLKLIEALTARLADLERSRPGAAAAASKAPEPVPGEQAQDLARLQESVDQMSDSLSRRGTDTGLPVHGFADVGGAWSGGADPQKLRGFNGGTLDLYLTPQFGDRVKSLIELAVEYGSDGALAVDMERLQIGYTVSDSLTLWAGRFHTPYGLWNTFFHHGANLQTAISRPRFLDFEDKGGILPAHSVGVWASGKAELGGGKLGYDAYVANGPSIRHRTLDFNPYTDDNNNKMLGLNLGYSPRGILGGLTVGLHGFSSEIHALSDLGVLLSQTKVRMLGSYFGYDSDDWEVFGEFYGFRNTNTASGASRRSHAAFVQVGRTLGQWTPYLRVEQLGISAGDNYFLSQASGRSYRRASGGLRYALDPRSSFKVEYSATRESAVSLIGEDGLPEPFAGGAYRRASFQYSIAF